MALKEQPLSRFPRFFRLTPPEERPREYFVLDFETTGLDPQLDVITEIAVLRCSTGRRRACTGLRSPQSGS
mgnify:CR=1 FL=1